MDGRIAESVFSSPGRAEASMVGELDGALGEASWCNPAPPAARQLRSGGLRPQSGDHNPRGEQLANIVSSGIQPLHNLTVLRFIEQKVGAGESISWTQQQIERGFTAIENLIKDTAGKYATGDEIQLADIFLAPQIYAALNRTKIDMSNYPTLARLNAEYEAHAAFRAALPDRQPDAPSSG